MKEPLFGGGAGFNHTLVGLGFPYELIYKTWLNSFDLKLCSASLMKFYYFALMYAVTSEFPSAY